MKSYIFLFVFFWFTCCFSQTGTVNVGGYIYSKPDGAERLVYCPAEERITIKTRYNEDFFNVQWKTYSGYMFNSAIKNSDSWHYEKNSSSQNEHINSQINTSSNQSSQAVINKSAHDNLSIKQQVENYVNSKLENWQKKDEFEKTTDYLARVSEENRKSYIAKWQQEKIDALSDIESRKYGTSYFTLKEYDADNETYLLKGADRNYVIRVPLSDAPIFRQRFESVQIFDHKFILTDEGFKLSAFTMHIPYMVGNYTWSHTKDNPYQQTTINYNFEKAEINLPTAQENTKQNNIEVKQISVGKSDVDVEIPTSNIQRKNTFALIIGNENYKNEIQVEFATNDAETLKKYAETSLGIPSQNIHLVKDASYGEMLREIGWLSDVGKAYKREAKLIFYYAGHGMPDETSKNSYLLPTDGSASISNTAISLNEVYNKLSAGQTETVTVLLDACFSGSARNGMLAYGRGVIIKPKEENVPDNMIVMSAVSGDQTAYPYKEKAHGLFTYFLLQKLKESKGKITYGNLSEQIINAVVKQSIVTNNKVQNPEVKTGINLEIDWRDKQF